MLSKAKIIPLSRVRRPARRAGAAYVLVLSTGVLLTVIGLGLLTASRGGSRAAANAADLSEAAALAESGVEWGLAAVERNASFRTTYTNNIETAPVVFGRGRMSFKLVDESDGNLANNSSDAVRVLGIGRCGAATRVYSVNLVGSGASLDSLKNPAQAGGNLSVTANVTVTGGPVSANSLVAVASGVTLSGDVEGTSLDIDGTVTGGQVTLSTPRSLPQAGVFDTYKAQATTIAFAGISGGTINNRVISGGVNPWGSANAAGVYYIKVPSGGTLTIKSSRLVATLIIEVDPGGTLITSGAFAWDPPRTDYPTLVVKGRSGSTVSFGGSATALSESLALMNFNPTSTPNASGVSDGDVSDSYPAEFHGLLHVVGTGFTTYITNYFNLKGSLIAEGTVSVGTGVKLTADPALASNPPVGYTAASEMIISPGTWQWDATP